MPLGIDDARLAKMRAQVAQLLPDTAVIKASTNSSDSAGGWSENWAAVTGGTVACRVDPFPMTKQRVILGEREALETLRILTVPYDAPLAVNRQVVIGAEIYEIRELIEDHSMRVSRRAYIAKIEGV